MAQVVRAPTHQEQDPEFNLQYYQRGEKKEFGRIKHLR
jgi:hypothetical protein